MLNGVQWHRDGRDLLSIQYMACKACWFVPLSIIVVLIGCLVNRSSAMRLYIHCSAGTFDWPLLSSLLLSERRKYVLLFVMAAVCRNLTDCWVEFLFEVEDFFIRKSLRRPITIISWSLLANKKNIISWYCSDSLNKVKVTEQCSWKSTHGLEVGLYSYYIFF